MNVTPVNSSSCFHQFMKEPVVSDNNSVDDSKPQKKELDRKKILKTLGALAVVGAAVVAVSIKRATLHKLETGALTVAEELDKDGNVVRTFFARAVDPK